MRWFLLAFSKYATFAGRSQRSEYWYFLLFYFLIAMIISPAIEAILGIGHANGGIISWIAIMVLTLPAISVTTRRLHDIGKSGWWQLIGFIPIIGGLILLIFVLKDSHQGRNEYGENPKSKS